MIFEDYLKEFFIYFTLNINREVIRMSKIHFLVSQKAYFPFYGTCLYFNY